MTIIAGYTFDTAEGAGQLLDLILDLSRQGLISVEDAALATWPEGKKQCTIKILREFVKTAQEKLTEGASALFLVTSSAEQDRVTEAVNKCGLKFDPIYTTMSWEQEQQLREDLAA